MTVLLVLVAGWIACAVGTTGMAFAYLQGAFPAVAQQSKREDLGNALFIGLFGGPVGMVAVFLSTGFAQYGWRLR